MKRTLVTCIILLLAIVLLSGCIRLHTNITVNKDGSGQVEYIFAVNPAILEKSEEETFAELKIEAQKRGFQIEEYHTADYVGIKIAKDFEDINNLKENAGVMNALYQDDQNEVLAGERMKGFFSPEIKVDKSWFYTTIKLNGVIDLSNEEQGLSSEEAMQQQLAYKMLDLALTINLPVRPVEFNADKLTNNGRTLTWQLIAGQKNEIIFKVQMYNLTNIIITAIAGLIILVIIIYLIDYLLF